MADPYAPPGSRRPRAPGPEQGRGGPGGPPSGAHRRPLAPPRPPDPSGALRTARLAIRFSLLVVAGIVAMSLHLPWSLASLAFLLAAVVVGVQALACAHRARVRAGAVAGLWVGLVVAVLVVFAEVVSLFFYPSTSQRQQCLDRALTATARAACQQAYQQDVLSQLSARR